MEFPKIHLLPKREPIKKGDSYESPLFITQKLFTHVRRGETPRIEITKPADKVAKNGED